MPWEVPPVSELRLALVHAVRSAGFPAAAAARRFGVSRKTAFKWLARYDADPDRPLADRPRCPHHSSRRTPEAAERPVLYSLTARGIPARPRGVVLPIRPDVQDNRGRRVTAPAATPGRSGADVPAGGAGAP
jgi:hypothetical protein